MPTTRLAYDIVHGTGTAGTAVIVADRVTASTR
jgi:hypothetical protein